MDTSRRKLLLAGCSLTLAGALGERRAFALLDPGDDAPDAKVVDADDKSLSVSSLAGVPVVIVYEDKASGSTNKAFKDDLRKLMGEDAIKAALRVIPIADVSEHNSWPAKGFVKDAIREESKKTGLTIYCDWDGSFRKKYDLEKGASNVVVIGRSSKVQFTSYGKLSDENRRTAERIIRAEVAKKK